MTAKERLRDLVDAASEEEAEWRLERWKEDCADLQAARIGREEAKRGQTVPWETVKARLGLPTA